MDPVARRSTWRPLWGASWLGLSLWLLSGCAADRSKMDRALMAENGMTRRNDGVAERYTVHCPDVLSLSVEGRPDLGGVYPVGPDGRMELGNLGRLRVDGRAVPEISQRLAEAAWVRPDQVHLRVAEYKSQQIYLFGQVIGLQRAVAYQGQETVLDLLQRVGGITPGAASNDVYVIRPHIALGKQPEVFHIDLRAIIQRRDLRTNLRLQPFDEVHVGETRQSYLESCVPPCLRPVYEALCGLRRSFPFAEALFGIPVGTSPGRAEHSLQGPV